MLPANHQYLCNILDNTGTILHFCSHMLPANHQYLCNILDNTGTILHFCSHMLPANHQYLCNILDNTGTILHFCSHMLPANHQYLSNILDNTGKYWSKTNVCNSTTEFVKDIRNHMRQLQPVNGTQHGGEHHFIFMDLHASDRVFVRRDLSKRCLQMP
ncbi:hypothetical protein M8J75_003645 [Diaphorina citri]|nr:hypothetical protein M8J75_003645 [Diaphorina citri]